MSLSLSLSLSLSISMSMKKIKLCLILMKITTKRCLGLPIGRRLDLRRDIVG